MIEGNIVTLIVIVVMAGVLSYRVRLLQKKLWYLSIEQILYLVVIPGIVFTLAFSYLQTMSHRPLSSVTVLPDKLLVNLVLLSILFSYGGIVIHAIAKMYSSPEMLRYDNSDLAQINKYFHLQFSHNLVYSGGLLALVGFTLLELNHIPVDNPQRLSWAMIKGVVLGLSFLIAMYNYTRYLYAGDGYKGKWSDLKMVFMVMWLGFILILYGVRRLDPRVTDYQLLVPALVSFGIMTTLSFVLVFRRLKRGWRVYVSQKRLRRLLLFWED